MSVNLKKHQAAILDAWKKVTENEDGYDWALFGYEGKSVDLKVDAIGSGGVESVAEEINEGKIQYAFVRVHDPNTNLVKFLLINFQGEAVLDLVHKGTCSNHIGTISKFLKNHLTITASNIDDLDTEVIMKKLGNITSTYNFQERIVPNDEKFVVGTNYSKIQPNVEINSKKRDEFWRKEEEMEKTRVAAETEARRLANMKIEEERLTREQKEHAKREQTSKDLDVKKAAVAVKPVSPIKAVERVEESSTKPRAEEMRTERRKEAQELIGNKVNAAKLMFQQQAAQSAAPPKSSGPPAKPIRKTIPKVEPEHEQEPPVAAAAAVVVEQHHHSEEEEQFSTIKRSPKTPTTPENDSNNGFIEAAAVAAVTDNNSYNQQTDNVQQQPLIQPHAIEEHQHQMYEQPPQQQQQHVVESNVMQQQYIEQTEDSDQPMVKAVALYDYQAVDDTEISFDPGDLITHIDQIDAGWWQGYTVRFNIYGLFPANYVQIIEDGDQTQ